MSEPLRTTPLHGAHRDLGARMIGFGGWDMPIQYSGILAEHQAVRTACGMFDVSHMGEVDFVGPDALATVQYLTSNDASALSPQRAQYALLCHPHGGIVDDCIVYRLGDEHYRIVVNAANIDKDLAFMREHAGRCSPVDRSAELALIAVQGPDAVKHLADLGADLHDVPSFGLRAASLADQRILAARTGYTGEDGFELFVEASGAAAIWAALLDADVTPAGLGARDTLRLEARLPLYGNDIDDTTTAFEAGLGWVVKLEKGDFVGREALLQAKREGPSRRLVGFQVEGRGIVRPGSEILDDEAVVGRVTSGGPAPSLGKAIGLAYVPTDIAAARAPLHIRQRGKIISASQVSGPFYRRPKTPSDTSRNTP